MKPTRARKPLKRDYELPRPTVHGTNTVIGPMGGLFIVRNRAMQQGWNVAVDVADKEFPDNASESLAEADAVTLDRLGVRHIQE